MKVTQIREKPLKCNSKGCYKTPTGMRCNFGCQRGQDIILSKAAFEKKYGWIRYMLIGPIEMFTRIVNSRRKGKIIES